MDPEVFQHDIDAAHNKLRSRLGARGKTLERALRSAGRRLPRSARAAGKRLVEMQRMVANPRLRRHVSQADVNAALAELNEPLEGIDAGERRKDRLLGFLGSAVFNLMLLGALMIAVMRWRGLL